jgi:glycine/D-amino acid oxidase-like deaminating enzyme
MSKSCNPHHTIAVIGAGASGLACALAAARAGSTVILLEKTARLGGTVTAALIHTLGGLYDDAGEFLNPGLPVELVERLLQASSDTSKRHMGRVWVLNVDPLVYERVVEDWIASQSGITSSNG